MVTIFIHIYRIGDKTAWRLSSFPEDADNFDSKEEAEKAKEEIENKMYDSSVNIVIKKVTITINVEPVE